MKVGAENKKALYAMLVLLAIAIALLLRMFLSFGAPASAPTADLQNPAGAEAAVITRQASGEKGPPVSLDPTLRTDLLKKSEQAQYKGSGRNIFEEQQAPIPRPKTPVVVANQNPQPVLPPQPPPPPPIPLKFFGFASEPGAPRSVFLAEGDDVFIGREGQIVNRRYKIVHIGNSSVEIEDVLNNNRQSIPLTQG